MEKAFSLDESDARVLMELDQLYKKMNKDPGERLQFLEDNLSLVEKRDDLYLERITLYNQLKNYQKAKGLIAVYKFHPWEGGEGRVIIQYLICHLELAKQAFYEQRYDEAVILLEQAENYPANLGEGKLTGTQENDIHYWKGLSYKKPGDHKSANKYFNLAVKGISEPVQAIFYNDPQPDKILYQGMAWMQLGDTGKAAEIFMRLADFGHTHLNDDISIDYFAVSLPDLLIFDADLNIRNKIHCLYLMGLGNLGLGKEYLQTAAQYFDEVLQLDTNHQGALIHKQMTAHIDFINN